MKHLRTAAGTCTAQLTHLDILLRTLPGSGGDYGCDAMLIAADAMDAAALALDQAADTANGDLASAFAAGLRTRADRARDLAPIFAPAPLRLDRSHDLLRRETPPR